MRWQAPFVTFAGHLGRRCEDVQRLLTARRFITAKIIVPRKCVLAIYQRVYWIGSLLHLY
jgi:hypothetical protein